MNSEHYEQASLVRWFVGQVYALNEMNLIIDVDKKGHLKTVLYAIPNETGIGGQAGAILGAKLAREGRLKAMPDLCLKSMIPARPSETVGSQAMAAECLEHCLSR